MALHSNQMEEALANSLGGHFKAVYDDIVLYERKINGSCSEVSGPLMRLLTKLNQDRDMMDAEIESARIDQRKAARAKANHPFNKIRNGAEVSDDVQNSWDECVEAATKADRRATSAAEFPISINLVQRSVNISITMLQAVFASTPAIDCRCADCQAMQASIINNL